MGRPSHSSTTASGSALEQAREAAGSSKDVEIAGGAATVRQYLGADQLDELVRRPTSRGDSHVITRSIDKHRGTVMPSRTRTGDEKPAYSYIERVMISHAHPAKLGCDLAGVALGIGLIWRHRPIPAGAAIFGLSFVGSYLVRDIDIDRYGQTNLGQWMLGQAKPLNLLVRTAGFSVLLVGLWLRSPRLSAAGILGIVLGRALSPYAGESHSL